MADNDETKRDVPQKAIALSYDKMEPAPRVAAKGAGEFAERIMELAKEHDIPIHEDAALVDILDALELDDFIPLEAYVAVAEILSYIYKKNASHEQSDEHDDR